MFENHVIDYYIKTFMKLTTGFDLNEDVFPFLEGNVLFDGPDPGNEIIYQTMVEKARTLFVDLDVESSLNYDRLKGEISRSIFMSGQKYRNRIIYPKIFERVFCILIDPDTFKLANKESELREFLESSRSDSVYGNGEYTQYYATISLKPEEYSDEYTQDREDDPSVEQQQLDSPLDISELVRL